MMVIFYHNEVERRNQSVVFSAACEGMSS
jgi:hypothetical protein